MQRLGAGMLLLKENRNQNPDMPVLESWCRTAGPETEFCQVRTESGWGLIFGAVRSSQVSHVNGQNWSLEV